MNEMKKKGAEEKSDEISLPTASSMMTRKSATIR